MNPLYTLHATRLGHAAGAAGAHHHGGGISTAAIVLAAIAGALALASLVWALARLRAFEPRWTHSTRHALDEAALRASSTWSEFADWVRLGR
jgi:hypothetical protein